MCSSMQDSEREKKGKYQDDVYRTKRNVKQSINFTWKIARLTKQL